MVGLCGGKGMKCLLFGVVILLLLFCGSQAATSSTPTTAAPTTAAPPTSAATSAAAPTTAASTTVAPTTSAATSTAAAATTSASATTSTTTASAPTTAASSASTTVAPTSADASTAAPTTAASPPATTVASTTETPSTASSTTAGMACSSLEPPVNGLNISEETAVGSQVNFMCKDGYTLSGTASRLCQSNGSWSGTNDSRCNPMSCDVYPPPGNGSKTTDNRTFGSKVAFKCNTGYNLTSGEGGVSCVLNSNKTDVMWSGSPPVCSLISDFCPDLGNKLKLKKSSGKRSFNTTVTFSCESGYNRSGSETLVCQSNRTWNGEEASCLLIPNYCDELDDPENGSKNLTERSIGTVVGFTCSNGYDLGGSNTRQCQANKTWTGSVANCTIIERYCPPLPSPDNGEKNSKLRSINTKVTFNCSAGYSLNGSKTRSCEGNGKTGNWSGTNTTCSLIAKYCPLLLSPVNGAKTSELRSINTEVTFSCDAGYNLVGSKTRLCQAGGNWDGFNTTCTVILEYCPNLLTPQNGVKTSELRSINTEVTFSCDAGYNLVGSKTRLCQAGGNWNGFNTTCTALNCTGLSTPNNSKLVNGTGREYKTVLKYECDTGYNRTGGDLMRTCDLNEDNSGVEWTGTDAVCTIVDCGPLDQPTNGKKTGSVTTYNSVIAFECNKGHSLDGSEKRYCQENGDWNGTQPICDLLFCPDLNPPGNGSLDSNATAYISKVTFSCNSGYTLYPKSDATLECVVINGSSSVPAVKWDKNDPKCGIVPQVKLVRTSNSAVISTTLLSPQYSSMSNVTIDCQLVTGYPETTLEWKIAETSVSTDTSDDVYQKSLGLKVQRLEFQSFGTNEQDNYTCTAVNPAGSDSATFEILLQVVPDPPLQPTTNTVSAFEITVTWVSPGFDGRSPITEYEVGYRKKDAPSYTIVTFNSSETSFSVKKLKPYTDYEFRVRARNKIGYSSYSQVSMSRTLQFNPSPPQNVTATVLGSYSVNVKWQEPSETNGIITGYRIRYSGGDISGAREIDVNGGTFETTVASLKPFREYEFSVKAKTEESGEDLYSNFSDAARAKTDPSKPTKPAKNIESKAEGQTSISVKWEAPDSDGFNGILTGYNIRYTDLTDNVTNLQNVDNETFFTNLTGLASHTNYSIIVYVVNTEGEGPPSDENVILTGQAPPTVPPQNISITVLSSSSIRVTWLRPSKDDIPGILTRYRIYYQADKESRKHEDVGPGVLTTDLNNLKFYTFYTITMVAGTGGGFGPEGPLLRNRTLEDLPGPPALLNITTSATAILASWEAPPVKNGVIRGYRVKYSNDSGVFYLNSTTTSVNLTSLNEFTQYNVSVQARTGPGLGNSTDIKTVKTGEAAPSAPPQNVFAVNGSSTSLRVSWTPPPTLDQNGRIRYYMVAYNRSSGSSEQNVTNVTSGNNVALSGLEKFVKYTVTVRAVTVADGPPSSPITVSTDQDTPEEPQSFSVTVLSSSAVTVTWAPPAVRNGIITGYALSYSNGSKNLSQSFNESARSYTVEYLNEYTNYTFSLKAATIKGEGLSTAPQQKETLQDVPNAPPTIVSIVAGTTTLTVMWSAPPFEELNGRIIEYEFYYNGSQFDRELHKENSSSTEVLTFALERLQEFVWYDVKVRAYTEIGPGPFSALKSNRTLAAPSLSPTITTIRNLSSTSLKVDWAKPAPRDINGIFLRSEIEYNQINPDMSYPLQSDPTDQTVNLTNLTIYTRYEIRVRIVTNASENGPELNGIWSNLKRVRTDEDIPDQPVALNNPLVSRYSVQLTWQPPTVVKGIITSYRLNYQNLSRNKGPENENISLGGSVTVATVTGLLPYRNYTFNLFASTSKGESRTAAQLSMETAQSAPTKPPANVTAVPTSSTSIDVTWKEVPMEDRNGVVQYYHVLYDAPERSVKNQLVKVPRSRLQVELVNLWKYVEYEIRVRAVTVENGTASDVVKKRTLQDKPTGAPRNVAVAPVLDNATQLRVSWETPDPLNTNGIVEEYRVYYIELKRTDVRRRRAAANPISVKAENSLVLVGGLKPYNDYDISMTAVTGAGEGPHSTSIIIRTAPADPPIFASTFPPPPEPKDDQITISLVGFMITNINGPIEKYELVVVIPKVDEDGRPMDLGDPDVEFPPASVKPYPLPDDESLTLPYAYKCKVWHGNNLNRTFVIGREDLPTDLTLVGDVYNGPLRKGTYYSFFLRAFTDASPHSFSLYTSSKYGPVVLIPSNSNVGLIVGVVIAVVIIVVLIIVILFLLYRRQRKGGFEPVVSRGGTVEMSGGVVVNPSVVPDGIAFENPPKIPVRHLMTAITRLRANGDFGFSEEYDNVEDPKKDTFTTEASDDPDNRTKNRYTNIKAYDHSRVHLHTSPSGSDYINGNHINGYKKENVYIATQGSVPDSINDFWRMVWEQNVHVIVMLTRLQEGTKLKCHQYWPDKEEPQHYEDITVTALDTQELSNYVVRRFSVKGPSSKEERTVQQWHFLAWPDHGVPQHPNALINFIRKSTKSNPEDAGPIVVHCSAGVGRTGSYIALHVLFEMMEEEGKVDIFGAVRALRSKRCLMVQTESQYIFIYEALLEMVHCGRTEGIARDLEDRFKLLQELDPASSSSALDAEFKRLNGPKPLKLKTTVANLQYNQKKNRFVNIVPYDDTRVKLNMIPGNEGSDFINANWIDSYWRQNAFIATQGPLSNTINDFWRMVAETQCSTIVMLTQLNEAGRERSSKYWPDSGKMNYGKLTVEKTSEQEYEEYIQRELMITDEDGQSTPVRQFQYTAWPNKGCPSIGTGMIDLIGQVDKWKTQCGDKPVIVHCSAGSGRTGCFIALSILIDRLKTEGVIDVFQTVKGLRQRRTAMVQTLDQYEYLYRTMLDFLNSYELYSNFSE